MEESLNEKYAIKVLSEMIEDRGYIVEYIKNDEKKNVADKQDDDDEDDDDEDEKEDSEYPYVIKAFHVTNHKNIILCFLS